MLPETHETIEFDQNGVCNICRQQEFKKERIDWQAKQSEFESIFEQYRGRYSYDCIVPFSGGKDSTFTLWKLVVQYGLKCLVICFDHGFMRPKVLENRLRTFKQLGVSSLVFRPNWNAVKKVMLESLLRKGDFCWHCHTGIFAYPMQMAVKLNVPLVIWGEPQAEYTAYYTYDQVEAGEEEVDEKRFNRYVNLGITAEDMLGMLNDPAVDMRDLEPFIYPSLRDLKRLNYRSICLGSYSPWDVKKQVELIKAELDWQEDLNAGIPPQYAYEKVECQLQGIRDYLKQIKRGYSRTSHLTSIDIRNSRLSREEAVKLVQKYEGKRPYSLGMFLEMMSLTEDEFNRLAMSHIVRPQSWNPAKAQTGEPLPDQEQWDRTAPLEREYTVRKLREFGLSGEPEQSSNEKRKSGTDD
jgi:N-acetyl sugar amidotransferase